MAKRGVEDKEHEGRKLLLEGFVRTPLLPGLCAQEHARRERLTTLLQTTDRLAG